MAHQVAYISDDADVLPRPPGALPGDEFRETCTQCGDCSAVCTAKAITLDDDGFPVLSALALCQDCGLCADICTRGAIAFAAVTWSGLQDMLAAEKDCIWI